MKVHTNLGSQLNAKALLMTITEIARATNDAIMQFRKRNDKAMYLREFLPDATCIALLLGKKNVRICNVLKRKSVTLGKMTKNSPKKLTYEAIIYQ
jgi:hypothetical protein